MKRLAQDFRLLFAALLGMALAAPLLGPSLYSRGAMELSTLAVLLGAVAAGGQRRRWIALALGLPAVLFSVLNRLLDQPLLLYIKVLLLAGLLLFVAATVLESVLRSRRIRLHELFGTLSVYLLLGMTWVFFYTLCLLHDPGALRFPQGQFQNLSDMASQGIAMQDLTYFSFVTLSTLGYGDIVPVGPVARTLAWMEAVLGQLFLAVMVAHVVSSLNRPADGES